MYKLGKAAARFLSSRDRISYEGFFETRELLGYLQRPSHRAADQYSSCTQGSQIEPFDSKPPSQIRSDRRITQRLKCPSSLGLSAGESANDIDGFAEVIVRRRLRQKSDRLIG